MKFFIVFAVALCIVYGNMNMQKYEECVVLKEAEGVVCDSDCKLEIADNCMYDSEVYNNIDCKYWYRNNQVRQDKEWSEEMGLAFHSCFDLCIEELGGQAKEYIEMQKECGSNILSVAFIGIILVLGLLI